MPIKLLLIFFTLMIVFSTSSISQKQFSEQIIKKYFDEFGETGVFIMYDLKMDKYFYHNRQYADSSLTPASTFKILNSLIGLETEVIADENFIIPWDKVERRFPGWNEDNTLKSAFKYSTVWYYQELARRVGLDKMKYYLNKVDFGNKETNGNVDKFWLDGSLTISPNEQMKFLIKLYNEELPFTKRSYEIIKNIMIAHSDSVYTIRAKTGWNDLNGKDVGWYIGYYQTQDNVYFFVNCLLTNGNRSNNFLNARKEIVYKIMDDYISDLSQQK